MKVSGKVGAVALVAVVEFFAAVVGGNGAFMPGALAAPAEDPFVEAVPLAGSKRLDRSLVRRTDNADGTLLPFLTANVLFETARAEGGVVVPAKALRFAPDGRPDGRTVFVAGADGAPRPVKVEVLLNNGLDASVKGEGLSAGDRVITGVSRRTTAKTAVKDAADGESASPFMPKMPRPPKRAAGGPPR